MHCARCSWSFDDPDERGAGMVVQLLPQGAELNEYSQYFVKVTETAKKRSTVFQVTKNKFVSLSLR